MTKVPGSPAALPYCGEWIGALVTFPSYVAGEGEPYKPTAVMWLELETGCVVDAQLVRPEEALPRAAGLFHYATRNPLVGDPRSPSRLRVSDQALALALRGMVGDVELVVAPTPEVDEVVAALTARFESDLDEAAEDATYLGPALEPADVAHLFSAAARLYRARPWDSIPGDTFISVSCERLGIAEGALSVVGQLGQSHGFSLFRSIDDAAKFLEAADSDDPSDLPAHFMFTFDDRRDLPPSLVREIAHHGWEVAGPQAFPSFALIDEDRVARGLTVEEHVGMTAIVTALAELVEHEARLPDAWQTGERVERTSTIVTAHGEVVVRLAAPLWVGDEEPGAFAEGDPATWDCVLDRVGAFDPDRFEEYLDAFMARFQQAPEATEDVLPFAEMLVEYAASGLGATIVGLTPQLMNELLFEIVPNKVMVEPEAAPRIVAAMRGLLTFADRELGARHAQQCLAALGPNAASRLARELADDRNFGIAKSLFRQGQLAGFDMTSEAGIAAFVEAVHRGDVVRRGTGKPAKRAKPAARAKTRAKATAKPSGNTAAKTNAKSTKKTGRRR